MNKILTIVGDTLKMKNTFSLIAILVIIVLGFAYKNEAIEKDDNKGLKYDNSFKISITNFGVETSKIYQII